MIYDEGWDPYDEGLKDQYASALRKAATRRRDKVVTYAAGYALVFAGMLWLCLRWVL